MATITPLQANTVAVTEMTTIGRVFMNTAYLLGRSAYWRPAAHPEDHRRPGQAGASRSTGEGNQHGQSGSYYAT
ncbi:hypothetical protein GCM10027074_75260 [Streptomyces deserti]